MPWGLGCAAAGTRAPQTSPYPPACWSASVLARHLDIAQVSEMEGETPASRGSARMLYLASSRSNGRDARGWYTGALFSGGSIGRRSHHFRRQGRSPVRPAAPCTGPPPTLSNATRRSRVPASGGRQHDCELRNRRRLMRHALCPRRPYSSLYSSPAPGTAGHDDGDDDGALCALPYALCPVRLRDAISCPRCLPLLAPTGMQSLNPSIFQCFNPQSPARLASRACLSLSRRLQ